MLTFLLLFLLLLPNGFSSGKNCSNTRGIRRDYSKLHHGYSRHVKCFRFWTDVITAASISCRSSETPFRRNRNEYGICSLHCVSYLQPSLCVVFAAFTVCRICSLHCVSYLQPSLCVVFAAFTVCRICSLHCVSYLQPSLYVVFAAFTVCRICSLRCVSYLSKVN